MRPPLFYLTALVIVAGDQLSKWAITRQIPMGGSMPVLDGFLFLTHTRNTGGAFSLLQARNTVFIGIAAVAIIALIYAYRRATARELSVTAALALALGGAVGNLIDRVRLHEVIDFFDLRFQGRNIWPIFNVADSAITIGILVLAWHFLLPHRARPAGTGNAEPKVSAAEDESRTSLGSIASQDPNA